MAAECSGPGCSDSIVYSLLNQTSSFYVEAATGDVFLVSVGGHDSVRAACPGTGGCSLLVSADLGSLHAELRLEITAVTEDEILVLDTNTAMAEVGDPLVIVNKDSSARGLRIFHLTVT